MASGTTERHSFVVRLWREQGLPWRAWVQNARSQEQAYVQSMDELVDFVQEQMAGPSAGAADQEE